MRNTMPRLKFYIPGLIVLMSAVIISIVLLAVHTFLGIVACIATALLLVSYLIALNLIYVDSYRIVQKEGE